MADQKPIRSLSADKSARIDRMLAEYEQGRATNTKRKRVPQPWTVTKTVDVGGGSGGGNGVGGCCCDSFDCLRGTGLEPSHVFRPAFYQIAGQVGCGCSGWDSSGLTTLFPVGSDGLVWETKHGRFDSPPVCLGTSTETMTCTVLAGWKWNAATSTWDFQGVDDPDCDCTPSAPDFSGTVDGQTANTTCDGTKVIDATATQVTSFWRLTIVTALTGGCDTSKLEFIIGSTVTLEYYLTRQCGNPIRPFQMTCSNSFSLVTGKPRCSSGPSVVCVVPGRTLPITPPCCFPDSGGKVPAAFTFSIVATMPFVSSEFEDYLAQTCCRKATGTWVVTWSDVYNAWVYLFDPPYHNVGPLLTAPVPLPSDQCYSGDIVGGSDNFTLLMWKFMCLNPDVGGRWSLELLSNQGWPYFSYVGERIDEHGQYVFTAERKCNDPLGIPMAPITFTSGGSGPVCNLSATTMYPVT